MLTYKTKWRRSNFCAPNFCHFHFSLQVEENVELCETFFPIESVLPTTKDNTVRLHHCCSCTSPNSANSWSK